MLIYAKYLVCYDVSSNSRRKKFSDALKDLGLVSMQGSVFYGDLKPAEVRALARKTAELLDPKEDKCFWFPCRLEPASRQKITQSPETKYTLLLKALFNRGFFLAP